MAAISDMVRNLIFFIDHMIYGLVSWVYELILVLSQLNPFNIEVLEPFMQNVYLLIGLFAIFKITFSLLNAVVNPDLLTDEEKGFGKIIGRVMVALALISLIPLMFKYAMRLQTVIVKEQVFAKLFLGKVDEGRDETGNLFGRYAFSSFLFCDAVENPQRCGGNSTLGVVVSEDTNINERNDRGKYIYTYWILLSTLGGIAMLAILATFCFDIAIRSVKLGFLQIISPFAVVSYIDPASTKEGFFGKWFQLVKSTYLSLFFRLASLSFISFSLLVVLNYFGTDAAIAGLNIFVKSLLMILLIFGLLLFLKEAPKMLGDLFGVEDIGLGSINPLQKIASTPLLGTAAAVGVGGLAGGLTGGFGGAVIGAGAGFKSTPLGGAGGGGGKGGAGGAAGGGKGSGGGGGGSVFGDLGNVWSGARDSMTQLQTGDKDAKGGVFNKVEGKVMQAASSKVARRGYQKMVKEREELGKEQMAKIQASGDEYSIYDSPEFADSLRKINVTKKAVQTKEIELERLKNLCAANPADDGLLMQYAQAKQEHKVATKDFETYKKDFERNQTLYYADNKKYTAVSAYKDSQEMSSRLEANKGGSAGPTKPQPKTFEDGTVDFSTFKR